MVGGYMTRYQLLTDPDANTCNSFLGLQWKRGKKLAASPYTSLRCESQ